MVETTLTAPVDIITLINGKEADRWSTKDLVRDASELVAALSEFATLKAGDVILMGTPHQRVTIQPGDEVTVQAEDGIRDVERSRGLGDVYKRQVFR